MLIKRSKYLIIMGLILLFFIISCTAQPADEKKDEEKEEITELEGTWIGYEVDSDENKASGDNDYRAVFNYNKFDFRKVDNSEYNIGTFILYKNDSPKGMDLNIVDCSFDPYDNTTSLAIYKIEGNILTVVNKEPTQLGRPTEFKAAANITKVVLTKQN